MQEIKCRVGEPTDSKYEADKYYHRGDPLPQLDHSLCEEIENLSKVLVIKRVINVEMFSTVEKFRDLMYLDILLLIWKGGGK